MNFLIKKYFISLNDGNIKKKEDFDKSNTNEDKMTYRVNTLPNSLLNYIFYFKSLDNDEIKKYNI